MRQLSAANLCTAAWLQYTLHVQRCGSVHQHERLQEEDIAHRHTRWRRPSHGAEAGAKCLEVCGARENDAALHHVLGSEGI